MTPAPSTNVWANGNGRTATGKWAKGNPGGPGNPHAAAIGRARAAFYNALKDLDVENALEVIRGVMNDPKAKPADRLAAASALLDRAMGKPTQVVEAEIAAALSEGGPDLGKATTQELAQLRAMRERLAARAGCADCGPGSPCEVHA